MSTNRATTKNVLSKQILKPILAGTLAVGIDRIVSVNSNKSLMQSIYFGGIIAVGNVSEFAPIPDVFPSIHGYSGKSIEVKTVEILATFGSSYALDYVASGYNFNQYDLLLKLGIVAVADIASESIVDYIVSHHNN